MRFSRKLFLAILAVSVAASLLLTVLVYRKIERQEREDFVRTYQNQSRLVADTLVQLERAADLVGRNAVEALKERTFARGLPGNQELAVLASNLHVANFFATNAQGRFIRSTNGAPESFKNTLFDYCGGYRGLVSGSTELEQTPIVPSSDEATPGPFKYTMIPNHDRTGVLEAGVALDFIGKTLSKTTQSDTNLVGMALYSPNGAVLGSVAGAPNLKLSDLSALEASAPRWGATSITIVSKVSASTEQCCECDVKGLSGRAGTYFYFLASEVSTARLEGGLAKIRQQLFLLFVAISGLCWLFARLLTQLLASRINRLSGAMEQVSQKGDLSFRLRMKGSDEVSKLAQQFDTLVENLARKQEENVRAERARALGELASQVVHDIRSPLVAIEVALRAGGELDHDGRLMVRNAAQRIRQIAGDLLQKRNVVQSQAAPHPVSELLGPIIDELVTEKRSQYGARSDLGIVFERNHLPYGLFARVGRVELQRVLSNLIDNAVESISGPGRVRVGVSQGEQSVFIEVTDDGCGIPDYLFPKLAKEGQTYGKVNGNGLGLFHAKTTLERFGGSLEIQSAVGKGTTVRICLPRAEIPAWFLDCLSITASAVVVVDDEPCIGQKWEARLNDLDYEGTIETLRGSDEFVRWMAGNSERSKAGCLYLIDLELSQTGPDGSRRSGAHSRVSIVAVLRSSDQSFRRCAGD